MGKTISKAASPKYLIGIDEVGRGPLAGPVTVCAFAIAIKEEKSFFKKIFGKKELRDSKGMNAARREAIDTMIRDHAKKSGKEIYFSIQSHTAKKIDAKGIAVCIRELIALSLKDILETFQIKPGECSVVLDGGLKAPQEFNNQKTYIKGDTLLSVISFASILAKVHRDAHMKKQSQKYPLYAFGVHKGYGTLMHRNLIKRHGLSVMHRKTFCKI